MPEKEAVTKRGATPDWFMRGALSRIGETVDQFTGRNWQPSSSLATSGLIERLKKMLDAESREVAGKGTVVPHNIKLKIEWDKFSADESGGLATLENELLTAAADHINDRLYYTYAPLHLEVKPDYFTEGVKLLVSFDTFADEEEPEAEMNVTMPAMKIPAGVIAAKAPSQQIVARYTLNGAKGEKKIDVPSDGRFTVGRTGSNRLVLDDISVSKVHASVAVDADGGLAVADTGSTNGTFINSSRIAYGKAVPFSEADRVTFGTVEVTFEKVAAEELAEEAGEVAGDPVQIGDFEFRARSSEAGDELEPTSLSKLDTLEVDERAQTDPDATDEPADDGGTEAEPGE